jgi:cytochrome c peroxidase
MKSYFELAKGACVHALALSAALVLAACGGSESKPTESRLSELPPMTAPADNPITPAKVALGKQLFFDTRLSGNGQMSCQSCHYHHLGWTDANKLSRQWNGNLNTRHTPTMYNVGYLQSWYWDGRAGTLEANNLAAWRNQIGGDPVKVAATLNGIPAYAAQFQAVFGAPASQDTIVKALATFIRTMNSGESPWDRFEKGQQNAVSQDAKDGFNLFMGKGRCAICHTPPLYTNSDFHNVGLEAGKEKRDLGRFNVSKKPEDTSAFKTPTLRSVERSGPYFHDGSVASLEEAVRLMARGGKPDQHLSPLLTDTGMTDDEIRKVTAFLRTLTSEEKFEAPKLP